MLLLFFIIVAAMMMIVVRPSSCVLADRALAAVRSARPMRKYTTHVVMTKKTTLAD